jgi:hypothetical protein
MTAQFIKLSSGLSNAIYVNVERIAWFEGSLTNKGTLIWFSGSEDDYIQVSETYDAILAMIRGAA